MNVKREYHGALHILTLSSVFLIVTLTSLSRTVGRYIDMSDLRSELYSLDQQSKQPVSTRQNDLMEQDIMLCGTMAQKIEQQAYVIIDKYTPRLTSKAGNRQITTTEVMLSGSYADLLRTVDYIEQSITDVKLLSSVFRLTTDRSTKEERLVCTLVIQQMTKIQ